MRYPGGKGQAGVYQKIINLMPPHDVYIETHLGGGNILERKKPSYRSFAIDIDVDVIDRWSTLAGTAVAAGVSFVHGDAADFLRNYQFKDRALVYSDPPYMMSTRKGGKLYRHEMTDEQHEDLLSVLVAVPASVMVSGYRHPLYDAMLAKWRRVDFRRMDRGGSWALESLWMNYAEPVRLHDFSHLGGDFRARERIKRKRARWRSRLERLPVAERMAMLECLLELASLDVVGSPGMDHTASDGDAGS